MKSYADKVACLLKETRYCTSSKRSEVICKQVQFHFVGLCCSSNGGKNWMNWTELKVNFRSIIDFSPPEIGGTHHVITCKTRVMSSKAMQVRVEQS